MKKTIILLLTFICAVSFCASAEHIAETTYTSIDGISLLDFSYTGDLISNFVVKGTYSVIESLSKFDIMGGYKVNIGAGAYYNNATLLFLAGMRKSEFDTGLLLSADFRTNMNSKKVFMHDILEFISWQDTDVSGLTSKFLVGYKLDKNFSVKGGITWLCFDGESRFYPTFGIEASF